MSDFLIKCSFQNNLLKSNSYIKRTGKNQISCPFPAGSQQGAEIVHGHLNSVNGRFIGAHSFENNTKYFLYINFNMYMSPFYIVFVLHFKLLRP